MLKLTFVWEDDKNKTVMQVKEPNATEDSMPLTHDCLEGYGYLAFDTFKNLLKGVGYADSTISKYLLEGALDYCYDNLPEKNADELVNNMLEDFGIKEN